jgi:predicted nuclease of predicted toxin-antitoxin system
MSRPVLLFDHDVNEHLIEGLRRREPTVKWLRARDVGLAASSDDEVLAYAAGQGMIVVSHDVNTMSAVGRRRVAAGEPMAGLLLTKQSNAVQRVVDSLILIWSASDAEEWHGVVAFLPLT